MHAWHAGQGESAAQAGRAGGNKSRQACRWCPTTTTTQAYTFTNPHHTLPTTHPPPWPPPPHTCTPAGPLQLHQHHHICTHFHHHHCNHHTHTQPHTHAHLLARSDSASTASPYCAPSPASITQVVRVHDHRRRPAARAPVTPVCSQIKSEGSGALRAGGSPRSPLDGLGCYEIGTGTRPRHAEVPGCSELWQHFCTQQERVAEPWLTWQP